MPYCLVLLLCLVACGSDIDYGPTTPAANATITVGNIDFTLIGWRYQVVDDPNVGKLVVHASNGDACDLASDPNLPNIRVLHISAFAFTNTAEAYTQAPSGSGTYPIEVDAALGPAGSVAFYATDNAGQPVTPTNTPITSTTSFAESGNVTVAAFDPNSRGAVQGSALGAIDGTDFYYTFTATACP